MITETVPAGWQLTDLSCTSMGTGTSASEDLGTVTATITLAAGGSVTCTFTDTQEGAITIIKEALPEGMTSFSFTTTGTGLSNFSLQDTGLGSNSQTFSTLLPGAFVITETVPAGWQLTDLSCTSMGAGTSASEDVGTATATITLAAGGSVTCTLPTPKKARSPLSRKPYPKA